MATSFGNSSFGPRAKKAVASSRAPQAPTCGEEARARGPHSFAAKTPGRGPELRKPRASACYEDGPCASSFDPWASLRPTGAPLRQILPTKCGLRWLHVLQQLGFRPTREEDHGQLPRASSSGPRRRGPCAASDEWRKYQFSRPPTRGLRSMLFGFDIHVYGLHQRKFSASASILQITKPAYWALG